VNVALPSMAPDLGASESSLEWVVAGYGLAFAAFLITAGRLGDDVGRRRVYVIGLAVVHGCLGRVRAGAEPDDAGARRVAQGVAGAIVMPQVLSIVGVTYRGPDYCRALSRVRRCARAGGGGRARSSAARSCRPTRPVCGWRGCFLINVPIGVAALALTHPARAGVACPQRSPLDLAGATAARDRPGGDPAAADRGPPAGWPTWTWIRWRAAPRSSARFLRRQARQGSGALVDLGLFGTTDFSRASPPAPRGRRAGLVLRLPGAVLQQGRGLEPLDRP
jgi:MFS family permease